MKTKVHLDILLWTAFVCAAMSCRAPAESGQDASDDTVITLRMGICYRY